MHYESLMGTLYDNCGMEYKINYYYSIIRGILLYLSDDLMLEYTLCVGRARLVEVGQNTSIAITWNSHDQNL